MRSLRTAFCIALSLLFVAVVALPRPSQAQARDTWVQIEALPTLARAMDRAQAWSSLFPDVAGFRLRSGWFAVAIGPYERIEARQRLDALRVQGTIPDDSYLAEAASYGEPFWPQGVIPALEADAGQAAAGVGEVDVTTLPEADGAADPAPPVAVADTETLAESRRLEAALSREQRQEIQQVLTFEGHYTSAIDGAFGAGTRSAISAWQEANGHAPTGVLSSRQQAELIGGYRQMQAALGLREMRDNTAGIAVTLPMGLVEKGAYQPPFAHYDALGDSGVQVLLLSQVGDAQALAGLYEILQSLELVPVTGPRELRERGFTIEGRDATIVTHVEARLLPQGLIKGFMLVWPAGDEKRRTLALRAMQDTFTPLGESVLADAAAEGALREMDLLSGLKLRRPTVSRTGLFVDSRGHVLTSADAVGSCARVTIDAGIPVRVQATDPGLGLALLVPEAPLAPLAVAQLAAAAPRLGAEIAVSGYAYEGRLGAAVVTFGRLADLRGLDGSGDVYRLDVEVTPGEAGAPVLDPSGAVTAMLLPPSAAQGQGARQVLPDSVVFALAAPRLNGWLRAQGVQVQTGDASPDINPRALTERARDITVSVACWE